MAVRAATVNPVGARKVAYNVRTRGTRGAGGKPMATVACPGCGLPREAQSAGAPCPVCTAPDAPTRSAPAARAEPDPTADLPADARHLALAPPPPARAGWLAALAFLCGALAGVAGTVGVHSLEPPRADAEPRPIVLPKADALVPPRTAQVVAVAPHPRAVLPQPLAIAPDPRAKVALPLPIGRVTVVEFNEPDGAYTLPTGLRKGERVILKGKLKSLRVSSLMAGGILDATALEVSSVSVSKVDGGSVLKLNAPRGQVYFTSKVSGGSRVEVFAPDGEVRFSALPSKNGQSIDGGASVTVTARLIDLKGEITGADTKAAFALSKSGTLKVLGVGGTAVVEYRGARPEVTVGEVAPTATFRQAP